ncbi:MAG: glutaredoxin 3 [Neomegalonema sp.]|nr:glutaredoxin 3 [Neomegalonema sp.]
MKQVEIYTSPFCGYCIRAKRLLDAKGVAYREIDVFGDAEAKAEMVERAEGRRTVPQIFIGGEPIGGSDDLAAMEARGALDAALAN